jgi:hypothetical protein
MATATATLPDGKKVNVEIVNGRTQTAGLPQGTVVHTQGGNYTISGGSAGNYTTAKPDQTYAGGSTDPGSLMEGGGTPGVSYGTPIIGGVPDITNKVDPVEDPSERYIEELACKDVPRSLPYLIEDNSDFYEKLM